MSSRYSTPAPEFNLGMSSQNQTPTSSFSLYRDASSPSPGAAETQASIERVVGWRNEVDRAMEYLEQFQTSIASLKSISASAERNSAGMLRGLQDVEDALVTVLHQVRPF